MCSSYLGVAYVYRALMLKGVRISSIGKINRVNFQKKSFGSFTYLYKAFN